MAAPTDITDLSTTAGSNGPAGSESPGVLDDHLRAIAAIIKQNASKGADIASASSITIPAIGSYFVVTGTTGVTSIANTNAWTGRVVYLKFSGALTLTNSAGMILPTGANITTAAGDSGIFVYESTGVWRCLAFNDATADYYDASSVTITGGTLDGVPIGGSTPAAVTATDIVATDIVAASGTLDGVVIGGSTPAAGAFTDLTCTAFTSTGIDDNATAERLQVTDSILYVGGVDAAANTGHTLCKMTNNGFLYISGSNSNSTGAAILFRGTSGTDPGDMLFKADNETWMDWDESAGTLEILTGNGVKTSAFTFEANGTLKSNIATYETLVTADDDIPNKKYVDDLTSNSLVTAWVNFNGSDGSINSSNNVSGVVKNSTGDYTVTFGTAMSNNDYAVTVTPASGAAGPNSYGYVHDSASITTTTVRVKTGNTSSSVVDAAIVSVIVIGGV